jgi:hypothetical protein
MTDDRLYFPSQNLFSPSNFANLTSPSFLDLHLNPLSFTVSPVPYLPSFPGRRLFRFTSFLVSAEEIFTSCFLHIDCSVALSSHLLTTQFNRFQRARQALAESRNRT